MRVRHGVLAVLWVAGVALAFVFFPVREGLSTLVHWVRGSGALGLGIYGLVYVLAALFMLPGSAMTVAAGFLWGPIWGLFANSLFATLAAIAPFLLGRSVARQWVLARVQRYPKWAAIDAAVEEQGFKVVLLLRLSLTPYNLLNYALGLTRVRFVDYLAGTWLGMIPALCVLVYLGSLITEATELGAVLGRAKGLYWLGLLTSVVGAVLLVRMARRALGKLLAQTQPAKAPGPPDDSARVEVLADAP